MVYKWQDLFWFCLRNLVKCINVDLDLFKVHHFCLAPFKADNLCNSFWICVVLPILKEIWLRQRREKEMMTISRKGKSQTHGHRKILHSLLSVLQHPSGSVSKPGKCVVVFSSWWRKIYYLTNQSSLSLKVGQFCLTQNWSFYWLRNPLQKSSTLLGLFLSPTMRAVTQPGIKFTGGGRQSLHYIWHINLGGLFNAKSYFYIHTYIDIWFWSRWFIGNFIFKWVRAYLFAHS